MITAQDKEIQALVGEVRDGRLLLPELQRGYVWKAPQVRNLFDSLYRNYPSGQLLIWETDDVPFSRGASVDLDAASQRRPQLLLDGQQRLTSLTAVMLGRPLRVRDLKRPIDIAFNVYTEKFEVTGPRQRGEAGWISLTKLFTKGVMAIWMDLKIDTAAPDAQQILDRLTRLDNIKSYKYRVNVLESLSYDEVTDIFVRINSGGTTLSSADLALAQVSSRWRGVTQAFEEYQARIEKQGMILDTGLFLRAMALLLTGQSRLSLLFRSERRQITIENLEDAWRRVHEGLDQAIAFVTNNCGIDRPSLLLTKNLLITLCAFFDRFGKEVSAAHSRQLQRWVYMSLIWSRYSSTVETRLDQDYAALNREGPVRALIQSIEDQVGKRPVTERELQEQRRNSAYLTMSYVLARRAGAQDWFNGVAIGTNQPLELHHIFPKAVLREQYDLQADSLTVDQVANLAFLSKRANNRISSTPPDGYLPTIEQSRLRAQYVPMDSTLWTLDQFEGFLSERRRLLAEGINGLLRSLDESPSLVSFDDVQVLESRVQTLEGALREFVSQRLDESRGEDAWNTLVPADVRRSVKARIDRRLETHPYETGQHETLLQKLAHCQFSDYPKVILANWALFEDILGKQDTFSQHQRAVTEARNALAHNRPLSGVERASAEAGLLWIEACMRKVDASIQEDIEDEEDISVAK